MSREDLIGILEGELDSDEFPKDPINMDRELMLYTQEKSRDLGSQLFCTPASTEKDALRSCWECPPARVVNCARENYDPLLAESMRRELNRGRE